MKTFCFDVYIVI